MSKCYGLPGIRIGWLATRDHGVLERVLAVREQVTITNGALSETIAAAVLTRRDEFLDRARAHVEANLRIATEWMAGQPLLEWVPPRGGVVGLPRITDMGAGRDPEALFVDLAERREVFVVPGRCFELDNRFFRLGFGADSAVLATGLERIGMALAAWAGGEPSQAAAPAGSA
jgi:aspartate/methionine/tyrosine aminotransferase